MYYASLLEDEYQRRKRANERYSLRAFARDLGIDSGSLTAVLKGRRLPPNYLIVNMVKLMDLGEAEEKRLIEEVFRCRLSSSKRLRPARKSPTC